ncbi:MAG: Acriflavin resistance protein [Candidatus Wolfebacteria bacterium GW2011_GWE2_47_12]|nr:MAG: Acriflavin resistance protein [Candidatus Wolfebacteria bacterium GW2011_GWE2_47_12]
MGKQIKTDFDQLTHDFLLTLILVMGILFLIVGLKEAFVAGIAIPLVFFATFGVMLVAGLTLNFLSVFSLLLALGLLVDDAIVVVSATKQYLKTGKFTPEEAVLLVLNDFKVVLTTTTLTTVWAFAPLLFSTGIMGQYLKSIPITVSVTLITSLFIALMINHPLAAVLERIRMTKKFFFLIEATLLLAGGLLIYIGGIEGYLFAVLALFVAGWMVVWYEKGGDVRLIANKELADREWTDDALIKKKLGEQGTHTDADLAERLIHGIIKFDRVIPIYERYLRIVLATKQSRRKLLAGVFGIFVFAIALPMVGVVKTEFFPASDYETMFITIEAPIGLKLDETDRIVRTVEERLMTYSEIGNFSTIVGRQGASMQSGGSAGNASTHLAGITITLVDAKQRDKTSYALADVMRSDLASIAEAKVVVEAVEGGPPSGAAFEARIKGDDLVELDRIAHDLEKLLVTIPGVIDSSVSLKQAAPEYTFVLDPIKLEQANLNAAYVGSVLRTAVSGATVTTVIRENKEIDVVARFDEQSIPTIEALQNMQVINQRKQAVFLKDVATIELKPSLDTITRIDQKRTAVLSAGVSATTIPNTVVAEFQKRIAQEYELPAGYTIMYGGENEQNEESVKSIIMAMGIAIILIISTLIIQFNSFRKAFIVLMTLPLALIGVFLGMALTGIPLSFPGLIGVLALFGIVVKNAIILIDKMNLNIKFGIPFEEAVIDAGKSRLEAIFITSVATIAGIIPITLSNEMWKALGTAMIFGLALSSFLTLFIIPVLFAMLVKPTANKTSK